MKSLPPYEPSVMTMEISEDASCRSCSTKPTNCSCLPKGLEISMLSGSARFVKIRLVASSDSPEADETPGALTVYRLPASVVGKI